MAKKSNIYILTVIILLFSPLLLISQTNNEKLQSENPVQLRKYVVDETNTLSENEKNTVMKKLIDYEKQTSNQIVIYIIPSLNGESLELLSYKIAEANKIGKKDINNGILLLIVKNDKKIRIEVGYGLEGALTDAISSSIIRNEIAPSFKKNLYYEGINKGVDAIILATKNEYENTEQKDSSKYCFGIPIFIIFIFGFIFISIIMSIFQRISGVGRKKYTGTGFGGFWGGGWGSGSGSSSGSGGSFGGFSGGGGSFGGGGASGGW